MKEPPEQTRRRMQLQRRRETAPEMALRRELYRLGRRYRVHVRPIPALRRTCDIVFRGAQVAVEVHGCFWHGCPDHSRASKSNSEWWREKIDRNRRRDADTQSSLTEAGWALVVVWEHDDPAEAAQRINDLVLARRAERGHG
ncbi:very short patch repair endonuclease [Pseudonocardia lutea]|uniref:Very short patch repair endonuclease n=1 Tax=Pseudonocardia lutea TaxID=2172015 RepID=A0ABW1IBM8_9PSEU